MGNCINTPHFPPLQKLKNSICNNNEGEDNFNSALPIEKIAFNGLKLSTSSAPPLPVLIDDAAAVIKPADFCKLPPKATIVVSKQQFEKLLRNSKRFASKGIAVQFSDGFDFDDRCPRWRPALPTIPEVHNY